MKRTVPYSDIIFKAFTLLVFSTLVLIPFAPGLAEAFVVEDSDVLVTPDTWRVIDPEFDNVYFRALWQSTANNLWISKLDEDGKFTVGETYLLATGLAPINTDNGNGPEWVYSSSGVVSIIYTVPDATYGYRLKFAKEISAGAANDASGWTQNYVLNAGGERCALGTYPENTGPSRILYQKLTDGVVKVYWRNLYNNPLGVETELSAEASQAHFSFDGTQIALAQVPGPNDPLCSESIVRNPMIYDIGTGSKTCVKQTAIKAGFPWILDLDEDGDKETMLFTLETEHRTIEVYQKQTDGSWLSIKRIQAQAPEQFISSPEPFKGNDGKWYVVYATTSVAAGDFYTDPTATGSIWIASLSDDSLNEQVTPATPAKRSEPEALTLPNGKTAIYYTYSLYENGGYSELGTLKMAHIDFTSP